jgi:hypothetical protein
MSWIVLVWEIKLRGDGDSVERRETSHHQLMPNIANQEESYIVPLIKPRGSIMTESAVGGK